MLSILLFLSGISAADGGAAGGLTALARAGDWDQVLQVASRRREQLPLRPEEALVAAHAARLAGEKTAQAHFLELALDSVDFGAVARVELAELILAEDPARAFDLVVGLLRVAPTKQLRGVAAEIVQGAVTIGVDGSRRSALDRLVPALKRGTRRTLELALALSAGPPDRSRFSRLLGSSTADLVALRAADALGDPAKLGALDRWRVAQTFYRHGLYERAAPILEALDGLRHSQIPLREVAFLRGRCSFRRGDWTTAADWYRKAISRVSAGERRAELEVHLGRTYELAGEMDAAIAAAQRAVRVRTTDDRRLFLARLRLRRGESALALAGISRLRGRSWRGPSAVIAAGLAMAAAEPAAALDLLGDAAGGLNLFWAEEARSLMAGLPAEVLENWRRQQATTLDGAEGRVIQRAIAGWLKLEPDPRRMADLRALAAAEFGLQGEPALPAFQPGLAARLWAMGLGASAIRWDPSGMPRNDARSTWWTARAELEFGKPWLAVSVADAAQRQASPYLPARGLPASLRQALYPLPYESTVRQAATRHGLPWSLLAGVAREESRWNPMVVSKVGARGLMQLMPATAVATGAANGRPAISPEDLFEPFISLDLGAAELGRLLTVFGGNRAAAVAAYNAGEAQAKLWLNQCGDDCSEARFMTNVSFSVTRGYTEKVLGAAAAYDEVYGEGSWGTLSE